MLFLFQDPLGDDHGLAYLYPQAALFREAGEGYADLLALGGEIREGRLVLKVRLARYPNPLEGPLGFSLATAVLWLDTGEGGRRNSSPACAPLEAKDGKRPTSSPALAGRGGPLRGYGSR